MGLILAWIAGESIVIYRNWKTDHRPPMPGQLIAVSGVYLGAALLTSAGPSGPLLGGAVGWGMTIAAFLNLAPSLTGGSTTSKTTSAKEAA